MTALEAQQKTDLAKQKTRDKLFSLIDNCANKGYNTCTIYTTISQELLAEMQGFGYTVENANNVLKISW